MADQTVTLVLDAAQYYREIGKITGQTDKFKGSADNTGRSLEGLRAKTEGRVAANIGAIARSFTSGGDAADILAESITRLGESFRGSLLFAAAAAAGIGLYNAIVKPVEAVIKLNSEIANLTRSRGTSDFLSSDEINKNLTDIGDKLDEIYAKEVTRTNSGGGFLDRALGSLYGRPKGSIVPALNEADQKRANELKEKAGKDINDLAEKTEKLNRVEALRSYGLKTQAALEENEIHRLERLGAIARTAQLAGVSGRPASQAADISFNRIRDNILIAAALAGNIPSSGIGAFKQAFNQELVRPFNTGPLLESQAQDAERLSQAQAKQGDFVESARLHRLALDKHEQASAIAQGRSLLGGEIGDLKFQGLIDIDKLQFAGLKTLDGLTIQIQ